MNRIEYAVERVVYDSGPDRWAVENSIGLRVRQFDSDDRMGAEELASELNAAFDAGFECGRVSGDLEHDSNLKGSG